jgi:hypothetical protein
LASDDSAKRSESGTDGSMETLERFQQNQRVIEDFSSRTLAAIPTDTARLLYVATLRDMASGRYRHEGLATIYSEAAVHEALNYCHQELFARILETPLAQQEQDLRECLAAMEGFFRATAANWLELEFYRVLVPLDTPEYLRNLFCSNLRILLALLATDPSRMEPAA